ncbi:hypothetical protein EV424DRAFT_1541941 [Suillus variegatus]|nr:hypothetical protein EV424DRAFT_1541941 [Suillus variegatus]
MATEASSEPKPRWNVQETDALLTFLFSKLSEAGRHILHSRPTSNDVPTPHPDLLSMSPDPNPLSVRIPMYADIEAYHSLSGVRWNNERGAGIEGEAARAVWNTFLQSSVSAPISDVFQYYNKHFNALAAILWHNTPIPQRWLGIWYAGDHHAFHLASAAASPLVGDMPNSTPSRQDKAPQLTVAGITLHDALMQALNLSTAVHSSPTTGSMNTSLAISHLPSAPSSIAVGSSLSKGKCTYAEALLETETLSYV